MRYWGLAGLITLLFFLGACGEDLDESRIARLSGQSNDCPANAAVGTACGGGIVYEINYQGLGILLVSVDQPVVPFPPGAQFKTTNTTSPGSGNQDDGRANTGTFNVNHPASFTCQNLTAGGFTDWYLPALNEMNAIVTPNFAGFLPGIPDQEFWTSNEDPGNPITSAFAVDLSGGPGGISNGKTFSTWVLCIRRPVI